MTEHTEYYITEFIPVYTDVQEISAYIEHIENNEYRLFVLFPETVEDSTWTLHSSRSLLKLAVDDSNPITLFSIEVESAIWEALYDDAADRLLKQ